LDINLDIQALLEENAKLKSENASLKTNVCQLENKILLLEDKLSKLELLLDSYQVKKNSHNSSIPPSKEIVKPNQSLRIKSTRKRGGQKGHKGTSLKMTEVPDQIITIEPNFCNQCGSDLSSSPSLFDSRRQVIEIPPIQPIYVEYQLMSKTCNCGHIQKGDYPDSVSNHIQYGATVQATIAYESVRQYVPFKRLSEKLLYLYNLPISEGTIQNSLHAMAEKARPIYNTIQERIESSTVVGGDETSVDVSGKNWWAWVFQNQLLTFIAILATRGQKAIDKLFRNGFANATLVSDRWRAHLNTFAKGHQLCLAHLLRDLNYLIELEKTDWAQKVKDLFLKAIELKKQLTSYNDSNPKILEIEKAMDALLTDGLLKEKVPKSYVFQRALIVNRAYLFPFLYYRDVPPDNNGSERAVRNIKVKQKISGQFNGGQEDFAILRSVIDTVIKNSGNVYETLKLIANLKINSTLAE